MKPASSRAKRRFAHPGLAMLVLVAGARMGFGGTGPGLPDTAFGEKPPVPARTVELDMAALNATAFTAAAQRDGLSVPDEELRRRVDLYQRRYPGLKVDPSKVRDVLLAEEYLERKGIRMDAPEQDGSREGKADAAGSAAPEEAELARKAKRTEAFLESEYAQREAAKLDDLAQLQMSSDEPPPMWPWPDLQIQGDPGECLAWAGASCLVSLGEYNAAVPYYPMLAATSRDSAKALIFRGYLSEKRLAVEARKLRLEAEAETFLRRAESDKEDYRWMQSARSFGALVQDMPLLQAAYAKYYGQYFGPREDVTLAVIGSSDSAYIDSLHRVFQAWYLERAAKRGAPDRATGSRAPKEPVLPWSYFKEREVPGDLAALADGLQAGQCSARHRSPLGHYLVRLVKAVRTPEVPFDAAYNRLVYLATRDKFLEMDSVVEARAKRHYDANRSRFASPDSFALRAWLIPNPEPASGGTANRLGKHPVIADTARFQAMSLSSLALPAELRLALQERVKRDSARTFFGPLSDRFGRWYFRVLSRRWGQGVLPYRLARKEILDRLTSPPEEQGSGSASEEALKEVGANIALAQVMRREQNRNPAEAGPPMAGEMTLARIRAEEARRRAEEARMLKEARVDLNRLFR